MKRHIIIGTVLLLALGMASFAGAANITIDHAGGGDYTTIQAGITAAVDGADTVWITDGTYTGAGNVNLDFGGKAITVRSVSDDPATCIIDCQSASETRGFYFHNSETSASVVRGLTVQNGNMNGSSPNDSGGGIYCTSSSPTIMNCTISGNSAALYAGGIFCFGSSSPPITNCTISGNSADHGGGLFFYNASSPPITNCTISGNSATSNGGGIYSYNSTPTITNCTISDNLATDDGGGICCYDSPTITNSILWGDSATTGNEIHVASGSPTADYCDIEGGCPASVTCTNCIYVDPLFVGGGDYHLTSGSPCINAGTSSGAPGDDIDGDPRPIWCFYDMGSDECSKTALSCGDFLNNASTTGLADKLNAGSCGCAGADVFYSFDTSTLSSGDTISATLSDEQTVDFSVSILNGCDPDANCLDSNTTTAQTVWNGADDIYIAVDGGEGTFDLTISCCASINTIYIGAVSYCTIQDAIDAASPGDTVWLADRTYKGFGNVNLDFGGKAITVRSVSDDPATCIIDCENASETRCFYFHSSETSTSVVRGLTIQNGNMFGSLPNNHGGGIYCYNSSPTITNCTLSDNSATNEGGGICCYSSDPTITNCTITGNSATNYGGGIFCYDSSDPTITNCTISGNSAKFGGGICCWSFSSPTITNCILWGDSATTGNDEIYVANLSPTADYCDIEGGCPSGATCTNCINQNPLFVGGGDYHLTSGSPCIDAGTNVGAPGDDIDGDSRPIWCFYDMGSDECSKTELSCGDSLNDEDTAGLADKLDTGSCGYVGADIMYKLDTSALSGGDTITATLSDEQTVDFSVSILNGCDPDANCLDSNTTTAQTVWNGADDIYIAVDGGEGTFDLNVTCAAPTATPTNTPTATPTNTPTATPTNTPTVTPTNTPVPATETPTPTDTPVPSTATDTPVGPTNTPAPVPSQGGTGVMLMVLLMTISLIAVLGRRVKN